MHIGRKFWSPHFCGSYAPWNLENIRKSTNNISFLCQIFINEITASDAGPDIIRSHLLFIIIMGLLICKYAPFWASCFRWAMWPIGLLFTLWPLPASLTYFLKTLILLITFEQWVLELWYFTWEFLKTRPFHGYQHFWPSDLDLWV